MKDEVNSMRKDMEISYFDKYDWIRKSYLFDRWYCENCGKVVKHKTITCPQCKKYMRI